MQRHRVSDVRVWTANMYRKTRARTMQPLSPPTLKHTDTLGVNGPSSVPVAEWLDFHRAPARLHAGHPLDGACCLAATTHIWKPYITNRGEGAAGLHKEEYFKKRPYESTYNPDSTRGGI